MEPEGIVDFQSANSINDIHDPTIQVVIILFMPKLGGFQCNPYHEAHRNESFTSCPIDRRGATNRHRVDVA